MSRLDRHVAMVQNKLALGRFVQALAWATMFWLAALWVGLTVWRMFGVRPIRHEWWIWGGLALCPVAAGLYALIKRPTKHDAATAIDERLGLKEKFSTALYARSLNDPFAQAAVKDAERTADNVSLHKRFPLEFPRSSFGTAGIAVLVLMTHLLLPKMDLFGKEKERLVENTQKKEMQEAKKAVERALQVIVQTEAKGVADEETIKQAKRDLEPLINAPIKDPEKAKRSAARALSDLDQALKDKIANNQRIADVESNNQAFKSLMPPSDEKGPVAEAQRNIAKGNFEQAVEDISKAVDKFDKMDEAEQKKAAEQMQNMAKQLQQMANNPQQQQQMQQQLQNLGMNQQQAQQAVQQMQQAAQGDKQAQQQLQQMAQQAMKQMNNGQGPNPQQQQQIQQMMKQMQAQANAQQQAQQMAQAAQQMAQAMQQAAQQQPGQQQGQQQQQQANAQQQGQQPGQQPGQQQGQQQGQQRGQQQGQQAGQQQQMAQAAQAMQQQLQAMQAMKADAQQVAAAQAAAAQAAQDAANAMNGQGQSGQGQGQQPGQWGQGQGGQWNNQQGQNNQPGQGRGGGIAGGDRTFKEQAPYQIKEEISQSQDIEGGKILASTLIKAKSVRGESTVGEATVAPPPEQEAADEVEQERISRPAQQAVKEYFKAWEKDAGAAAPAPAQPAQ